MNAYWFFENERLGRLFFDDYRLIGLEKEYQSN